jgi:predicted house-cleaning noncanonical NTP pyrophosphatase (MazG superfamily)
MKSFNSSEDDKVLDEIIEYVSKLTIDKQARILELIRAMLYTRRCIEQEIKRESDRSCLKDSDDKCSI